MAGTVTTLTPPEGRALRAWRRRLLRGRWRPLDLEFFHGLVAALSVLTALLSSVLVVGMTRRDGTVGLSVMFVAVIVVGLVVARSGARAALRAAERRTAGVAASEARTALLDAMARGATLRPGAAATFLARSADDIGTYVARAVPARSVAVWVPFATLCVLIGVDPWSAVICGGLLLVVPAVLARMGTRAAREAEVGISRIRSLATRALELLEGAVELRALGALGRGTDELAAATDRAVASTRRSLRIALQSAGALDVIAGLAVGLVAMTDGLRLLDGSMALGHALAAVLVTVEVFVPLRAAGAAFHAGADGRAALGILDAAERDARPPRRSGAHVLPMVASSPATVAAADAWVAAVPHGAPVVGPVRLAVPALGSLVITGPSGCGKTSLLRAIAGAPLVAEGTVLVGNADPQTMSGRQRAALIAVVDQRPFIASGSLRDNLVLGCSPLDDATLRDALDRCGLDELADGRLGLDAPVGEEGRRLSAGERTRLAVARAVVRTPGVLLLDEVGAHLDDAALDRLRGSLAEFLATRTVIEAAHGRALVSGAPTLDLGALAGAR